MMDVLEGISDEANQYVVRTKSEAEKLESDAVWLLDQLRHSAPSHPEVGSRTSGGRASSTSRTNGWCIWI
jgi:hypothetical protein